MILPINDDFMIEGDEMQWTLKQAYNSKKGKAWKNVGYYATLPGVVNAAFQRGLRCSEATTLVEAVNAAQKLLSELTRALVPEFQISKAL